MFTTVWNQYFQMKSESFASGRVKYYFMGFRCVCVCVCDLVSRINIEYISSREF